MKKIPQDRFFEMDDDVYVDALFPNMQVDVFNYEKIGYLVSTTFNDELFYEYYVGDHPSYDYMDKIVEELKEHVNYSVIKSL